MPDPRTIAAVDQGIAHLRDRFDRMGVNLADPDQLNAARAAVVFCRSVHDDATYLGLLRCMHAMGAAQHAPHLTEENEP